MTDDPHNTSDISDPVGAEGAKEDAETTAARRELKQTSISEKLDKETQREDRSGTDDDDDENDNGADDDGDKDQASPCQGSTPDTEDPGDSRLDQLRELVASPKKKRAHDELVADGSSTAGEGSSKPVSTSVAQSRTEESEPEKKRPRDRDSSTRRRSQDGAVSYRPSPPPPPPPPHVWS